VIHKLPLTKILETDHRAIITNINGSRALKAYLLRNGLTIGAVFYKNYSPSYAGLKNLTVNGRMISLRSKDYDAIEWVEIW